MVEWHGQVDRVVIRVFINKYSDHGGQWQTGNIGASAALNIAISE